ncbi:glycosyltransferase [Flavobacteriaceae bacterium F08102]|nr:glycosyltransferase [Flavobacteriaceae bacterium F08102]
MLVSIITVTFNSEETLHDTITSVLEQDYDELEYIIVDGGSRDQTIEIIKFYEKEFKLKNIPFSWISEPDEGIYDAYNKGITLAHGELIGILNSDDWYNTNAISELVRVNQNHTFSIVSGERNKVTFNKKHYGIHLNKRDIARYIHRTMPLNFPATLIHKNVYRQIGKYDLTYRLSADYDLIFRAYKAGVTFLFSDKTLVNMRNSGATGQLKNLSITAKEDYHIRKKNKVKFARIFYYKRLIFNGLIIVRNTTRNILNIEY